MFLKKARLQKAFPPEWSHIIERNWADAEFEHENEETLDSNSVLDEIFQVSIDQSATLRNLSSKHIYQGFIGHLDVLDKNKRYWMNKFECEIDDTQWVKYFRSNVKNRLLPRKCVDFNWKIFHGIIATEKRLKAMGMSDGLCTMCKNYEENVQHLLIDCIGLDIIWKHVQRWINLVNPNIVLSNVNILLGLENDDNFCIGLIVTMSKFCIWKRRNLYKYENKLTSLAETISNIRLEVKNHIIALLECNFIHTKKWERERESLKTLQSHT